MKFTSSVPPFVIAASALLLYGCATKQKTGTLIGAAAGTVVGAAIDDDAITMAAGAVIGGVIGNRIGARMHRRDKVRTARALERNAAGKPSAWANPDTGHRYRLTPDNTYPTDRGSCRDFELLAQIDGEPQVMRGTACRQPGGTWVTS